MAEASLQKFSCRVLQTLIKRIPQSQLSSLVVEAASHIEEMAYDKNGCHVLQRMLERASDEDKSVLIEHV